MASWLFTAEQAAGSVFEAERLSEIQDRLRGCAPSPEDVTHPQDPTWHNEISFWTSYEALKDWPHEAFDRHMRQAVLPEPVPNCGYHFPTMLQTPESTAAFDDVRELATDPSARKTANCPSRAARTARLAGSRRRVLAACVERATGAAAGAGSGEMS